MCIAAQKRGGIAGEQNGVSSSNQIQGQDKPQEFDLGPQTGKEDRKAAY